MSDDKSRMLQQAYAAYVPKTALADAPGQETGVSHPSSLLTAPAHLMSSNRVSLAARPVIAQTGREGTTWTRYAPEHGVAVGMPEPMTSRKSSKPCCDDCAKPGAMPCNASPARSVSKASAAVFLGGGLGASARMGSRLARVPTVRGQGNSRRVEIDEDANALTPEQWRAYVELLWETNRQAGGYPDIPEPLGSTSADPSNPFGIEAPDSAHSPSPSTPYRTRDGVNMPGYDIRECDVCETAPSGHGWSGTPDCAQVKPLFQEWWWWQSQLYLSGSCPWMYMVEDPSLTTCPILFGQWTRTVVAAQVLPFNFLMSADDVSERIHVEVTGEFDGRIPAAVIANPRVTVYGMLSDPSVDDDCSGFNTPGLQVKLQEANECGLVGYSFGWSGSVELSLPLPDRSRVRPPYAGLIALVTVPLVWRRDQDGFQPLDICDLRLSRHTYIAAGGGGELPSAATCLSPPFGVPWEEPLAAVRAACAREVSLSAEERAGLRPSAGPLPRR